MGISDQRNHVPNRLAVIPARGGSKRIVDKNIREFFGRPMIGHILDTARASGLFDTIHVSTESARIADVAAQLGFPPAFPRPAEFADDHVPLMPVLHHAASTFTARGHTFDEVWLLMACAPLLEAEDLHEAARIFRETGGHRPVLAVARFPAPFERAFRQEIDGTLVPVNPSAMKLRSQDLEPRFYDAGLFCAIPAQLLKGGDEVNFNSYIACPVDRTKAVDIDNEEDWRLAEIIFAGLSALKQR